MSASDERRKFERVYLPATATVSVEDHLGHKLGRVLMLGRGGFLLESKERFRAGATLPLTIVAPDDGIRRTLQATARYTCEEGVGFEFFNLEPDSAVEIGVLIGKYFSAAGPAG